LSFAHLLEVEFIKFNMNIITLDRSALEGGRGAVCNSSTTTSKGVTNTIIYINTISIRLSVTVSVTLLVMLIDINSNTSI